MCKVRTTVATKVEDVLKTRSVGILEELPIALLN